MNSDFFDSLYKGYAAENFVTSQLFENGFEAFRLPADFGLDLVVTNQFKKFRDRNVSIDSFPFAFQVKSRRLKNQDAVLGVNERYTFKFKYFLKKSEILTLKASLIPY